MKIIKKQYKVVNSKGTVVGTGDYKFCEFVASTWEGVHKGKMKIVPLEKDEVL